MSKTVRTADVANSINSLLDFLESFENVESSKDADLLKVIAPVLEQKQMMGTLITAMIMNAQQRLSSAAGLFVENFDFSVNEVSTEAKVKDQLLMQKALLRAGELMGRPIWQKRAVENFFAMNGYLWDSKLGFYSSGSSKVVKIDELALVLENLERIIPLLEIWSSTDTTLTASVAQAKNLRGKLSQQIGRILALEAAARAQTFSP
jgi:hypothetical protein